MSIRWILQVPVDGQMHASLDRMTYAEEGGFRKGSRNIPETALYRHGRS